MIWDLQVQICPGRHTDFSMKIVVDVYKCMCVHA